MRNTTIKKRHVIIRALSYEIGPVYRVLYDAPSHGWIWIGDMSTYRRAQRVAVLVRKEQL